MSYSLIVKISLRITLSISFSFPKYEKSDQFKTLQLVYIFIRLAYSDMNTPYAVHWKICKFKILKFSTKFHNFPIHLRTWRMIDFDRWLNFFSYIFITVTSLSLYLAKKKIMRKNTHPLHKVMKKVFGNFFKKKYFVFVSSFMQ